MTILRHAELATEPKEIVAGEPATLVFTVKDSAGNMVHNLEVVHEMAMHLLAVSEDMQEFQHLHPEQAEDGTFRVTHVFPHNGNYWLYADYKPSDTEPIVDQFTINVRGSGHSHVAFNEDAAHVNSVEVDGLRVTMSQASPLRVGEDIMLHFTVTDARTGEAVTNLQPYLGALAHFAIISQDGADFLHAHPIEKAGNSSHQHHVHESDNEPHHNHMNQHMSHDSNHVMNHHMHHDMQVESAAEVSAHTRFPRPGFYKIWAQFQRGGHVITVPFVVQVSE